MAYVFVASHAQYGPRRMPVKAFVIHMAEGGGTVGYLSRPNPRGVSVHYVVEYSGRVVQMVREQDASGSINPNDLRTTNDPDGFYGVNDAKAVMGASWRDPNSAAITVEVEGFARDGPNDRQHIGLRTLIADVRSRYPGMGLLGHRDFTSRKACPGKLVRWADLGGHGVPIPDTGAEPMITFDMPDAVKTATVTVDGPGHSYLRLKDGTLHPAPAGMRKRAIGPVVLPTGTILGDTLVRRTGWVIGIEAAFLLGVDVKVALDRSHRRSTDA